MLDAAQALLARHGARGLTARAIAAEAGVSKGALHYHFGSVERLVESAATRFFDAALELLQTAYGREARGEHRLDAGVQVLSEQDVLVFIELVVLSGRADRVRAAWARFAARWDQLVIAVFLGVDRSAASAIVAATMGAWFRRGVRGGVTPARFDQLARRLLAQEAVPS